MILKTSINFSKCNYISLNILLSFGIGHGSTYTPLIMFRCFYQCFTIKFVVEYSLNFWTHKLSFKCSFYFILISCKFDLLQNSSHEALTQSFQLAFSLRNISLNENGRALIPILFNVCMLLCLVFLSSLQSWVPNLL